MSPSASAPAPPPVRGISKVIQRVIREVHIRTMRRGLPRKIAFYLHPLERANWEAFEMLVDRLRTEGFSFETPEEYLRQTRRCVLMSFDDNYRSWFEALPLLERCGVRATFYINTEPLRDRAEEATVDAYYDRVDHHGDRTPLDSRELREIYARGHVVGSHTHSHPVLSSLAAEEAKSEIRRANEILETVLGEPVRHFSYPYGMRRHFRRELREYCVGLGLTVANGIPGMLHRPPTERSIDRSPWRFDRPLEYNLRNVEVDGRLFERLTGRAAVV